MNELPRRCFLHLAAGAAVACVACSGSSGVGPEAIGDVAAGNVKDLAVGALRAVGSQAVAIGRDAKGVYAMTLTCTHQGCNMATDGRVTSAQVTCDCHGSVFDTNGGVVRGPATTALAHFAVTVDGSGELTIHGGQEVDASTRLTV